MSGFHYTTQEKVPGPEVEQVIIAWDISCTQASLSPPSLDCKFPRQQNVELLPRRCPPLDGEGSLSGTGPVRLHGAVSGDQAEILKKGPASDFPFFYWHNPTGHLVIL